MNREQLLRLVFFLLTIFYPYLCFGIKTNINEVTDFFDKEINGSKELQEKLEHIKDGSYKGIENGATGADIYGMEQKEEKIQELNSISASELGDAGNKARRSEQYNFYDDGEFEVDSSKTGNKMHKEDVDKITAATGKLLTDLVARLKDFNIDCASIKGAVQREPTYIIELKQEEQNNTIYEQVFCEEPRNTYKCQEVLTMRCKKRGMRWDPWERRSVTIDGDKIYKEAGHLGYAIKWKKKRWGWHLRQNSAGWRQYLSVYLKIPVEQLHEQIDFLNGARGVGSSTHPVGERWRIVFDQYEFGYRYRKGQEVCEEWSKQWDESCILQ